ncbi:LOW QUALITY PROTEIN: sodium-dependent phosphate transport protein 1 [Dugong dugon]
MAQHSCLSLTMVAMVNTTYPHGLHNTSVNELPANNPMYNWSPEIEGIILSSISYGIVLIQIPSGYLSGIYSVKKMVGCVLFFSSLFNLFILLAAELGKTSVIVCVVQGITQMPGLISGVLCAFSLEFLLGPFIVLLLTGFISQFLGWPIVFYIFGVCGCALCLLWLILFYDDPKDHPSKISEKEFIMSSLAQQFSSSRQSLPIKSMLKSLPLWVISLGYFAAYWSSNIMTVYIPTYINSVLHVTIRENGLLSALPYLFAICDILAGQMADFILPRNILNTITIRKLFTTVGLLFPASFSMCLLYLSSSFHSTIIFLILASATRRFSVPGMIINALDIAPRYYGFLQGITNLTGITGGLIASTLTGIISNLSLATGTEVDPVICNNECAA